jgi:hypothetical protein
MKAAEAEAEMAHAELVKYQDLIQLDARAQEAALRREMNNATVNINQQLAEEKRLREQQAKASELAANMAELDTTLTSPFMTEDPSLAASATSAVRVRKDHFKVGACHPSHTCHILERVFWNVTPSSPISFDPEIL